MPGQTQSLSLLFFLSTFCFSPTHGTALLTSFLHSTTVLGPAPAPPGHGCICSKNLIPTHSLGRLVAETLLYSEDSAGEGQKKKVSDTFFLQNVIWTGRMCLTCRHSFYKVHSVHVEKSNYPCLQVCRWGLRGTQGFWRSVDMFCAQVICPQVSQSPTLKALGKSDEYV